MTLRIGNVDLKVLVEKQHQLEYISVQSRAVKQIEALVVGKERIGTVLQEEVYDIVVTTLCRPQNRGCERVTTLRIYVCTRLDKKMAKGVVVVDRCPLFAQSVSISSARLLRHSREGTRIAA